MLHVDVYAKIADRLQTKGWIKHSLGEMDGPCCLLGAIMYECDGSFRREVSQEIARRIRIKRDLNVIPEYYYSPTILAFNDHPNTTFKDVLEVLTNG